MTAGAKIQETHNGHRSRKTERIKLWEHSSFVLFINHFRQYFARSTLLAAEDERCSSPTTLSGQRADKTLTPKMGHEFSSYLETTEVWL